MKEYLIDLISKFLMKEKFIFEKKTLRFIKIEKERVCSIRLVFVHNVEVFIYYEIRFNRIESLIDEFYERKGRPLDPTIFINTGDLLIEPSLYKFSIKTSRTVEESTKNILSIIQNLAFTYFKKYQTLDDLNNLLN